MREWVAIAISGATLFILMAGGIFFIGHQDEKLEYVSEQVAELSAKVDDVREKVAHIEGYLAADRQFDTMGGGKGK